MMILKNILFTPKNKKINPKIKKYLLILMKKNLILIDSKIENIDIIKKSINKNTNFIIYNQTDSYELF